MGLSRTTGPVLDPIFSLRRTVTLAAGAMARLAFVTGAGDSRRSVRAIAERFSSIEAIDRTFQEASENYQTELQDLGLTPDGIALFNRLIGSIAFPNPAFRQTAAFRKDHLLDRTALWSHGISGDLPIVVVLVHGDGGEALIDEVTKVHDFSRRRGLQFDLVLLDERGAGDAERLVEKLQAGSRAEVLGKPGGDSLPFSPPRPRTITGRRSPRCSCRPVW